MRYGEKVRNYLPTFPALLILVSVLAGCGGQGERSHEPYSAEKDGAHLPPTQGIFDYQLGGAYDSVPMETGEGVPDVVVRDATATALHGAYSICYVNGFQTQPDEADEWLTSRANLLLRDPKGELETDPDWPDEYILDPSSEENRESILSVIGPIIDGCAHSGFEAVEIDNLDTWTRFNRIDPEGTQALARAYVDRAHRAGLAIGQKNAAEIATTAHDDWGFDFAITEECAVFEECGSYAAAYGTHVLQIEYPDVLADAGMRFDAVCADLDRNPLTILRDHNLVARGKLGYLYDRCD